MALGTGKFHRLGTLPVSIGGSYESLTIRPLRYSYASRATTFGRLALRRKIRPDACTQLRWSLRGQPWRSEIQSAASLLASTAKFLLPRWYQLELVNCNFRHSLRFRIGGYEVRYYLWELEQAGGFATQPTTCSRTFRQSSQLNSVGDLNRNPEVLVRSPRST
jgi:hypothetical protein